MRQRLRITKGDTVQVISGDDKGKRGKVLQVFPKTGRIKIQGVNLVKRHLRATPNNEGGLTAAGTVRIRAVSFGGDVKARNTTDFEFPGVGDYAYSDATAAV